MPKPTGRPTAREIRSQEAQLDKHHHGTEKGVKWKMSVKDGSSEKGSRHDTGLKGEKIEPQIYQLQRLLDRDKDLSAYGLRAEHANNAIQITGIVDTLEDKDHLKALLAGAGIKKFADAVSISTDGQVLDAHVVLEVREELEADPELEGSAISVECSGGTIFLAGEVDSRFQEKRAVAAARKARGVTRVISHLTYLSGDVDLDTIFHSQVQNDREHYREQ